MGRRPQPEIHDRLLDACADHALAHGLPDRLAPLARAVGTSSRMLVYHFGTRDDLLRAVLRRARERQLAAWGDLLRVRPDEPYPATLARAWTTIAGPGGAPFVAIFDRLRQDTEQQLWPDFRRTATTDWLGPLTDGMRSLGRPELATVVLAVIRGLLADLAATGDRTRVDRAFTDFLVGLDVPDRAAVTDRRGPDIPRV